GFLGLERIRELTVAKEGPGLDFDTALELSRAGTVFTTHTPVPAGIDRFPRELISQYFGGGSSPVPGVPADRVLALGAEDYAGGDPAVFNMAVMGFRLAQRANGVSELHGHVSRGMFNGLWPAFDEAEVPIGSITNGVHGPSWVAREVFELAAKHGVVPDTEDVSDYWSLVEAIPAKELWDLKHTLREHLVKDARSRLAKSTAKRGYAAAELAWTETALDPDVLTIGFARRVPSYKRLTLMLRDPERLRKLLLHPERPIQLIIAGKSHPADDGGKKLIQEMVKFADDPDVRHRIVFLPNYDIAMAQPLYPGCDVWLNNPLRPYEACGTSGMKAALNGGLNLSILDGWWAEGHDGANGWAIGGARLYGPEDQPLQDELDCAELFRLLEEDVVPEFYARDAADLPQAWLRRVRHSLASIPPRFSAERMVGEYAERAYLPLAREQRRLSEADFAAAAEQARRDARLRDAFGRVAIRGLRIAELDGLHAGDAIPVRATLQLGELAPEDLVVELLLGRPDGPQRLAEQRRVELQPVGPVLGGECSFEARPVLDQVGRFAYGLRVRARDLGSGGLDDLTIWA
ncbi:MAG: alpha-glucan family phosphorylase, partial [Nocardioidaceae bacterium]|nr:alpha-glucan family phosphorylase [Nocardioidaceae bacterium]